MSAEKWQKVVGTLQRVAVLEVGRRTVVRGVEWRERVVFVWRYARDRIHSGEEDGTAGYEEATAWMAKSALLVE